VPVAQASNPGFDDLPGERQRACLELIGDRRGCGQHVRKGPFGRTRRDSDGVCKGEQRSAGEAVVLAEHGQREGVIAVWQRGGQVVGGGGVPFA
jgi:hypothetical protein